MSRKKYIKNYKKEVEFDYVGFEDEFVDDYYMSATITPLDSSLLSDEELDYDDSYQSGESYKPRKVLHTVDSLEYDSVTEESLDILEEDNRKKSKKKSSLVNIVDVNPDNKAKKSQSDIDKDIVKSFYDNPTPERFSMIWKRFYYGVHSHACKLMGDWERAEDMVQETFQRAWEKRDTFDINKGTYSTWIYRICFNICATNLKQNSKKRSVDIDVNDLFDNTTYSDSLDNALSDNVYYINDDNGDIVQNNFEEIQRKIYDTSLLELQQMDSTFCQIMTMKDIDNMTLSEIARQLDMKESKVKNIYYTNRTVLGEKIKEKYGDLYQTYLDARHDRDDYNDTFGPAYVKNSDDNEQESYIMTMLNYQIKRNR